MTEDATETVEAEALPIDEESGEIDYEKVNGRNKADDDLKEAIEKAKAMPIAEVIAFSVACGIAASVLVFSLLSLAAVINVLFLNVLVLLSAFGLGAAFSLGIVSLIKLVSKKKDN